MPRISVVMPAYNAQQYIAEAIDSILSQTFSDFEFIIINDGSTDKTVKIVRSYKDQRMVFVDNNKNQGIVAVLNQGLGLATGEYIARMDSDDISLPMRFEKQIDYMDNNPDVGVLGSWVQFFPGDIRKNDGHHKENITYMDLLLNGWCVNHPTVMMRKSVLDKHDLRYRMEYTAEDYDLWARAICFTQIRNIQEILLNYRWHDTNLSTLKREKVDISVKKTKQTMLDFLTDDTDLQNKILNLRNNDMPNDHLAPTADIQTRKIKLLGFTVIKVVKETR